MSSASAPRRIPVALPVAKLVAKQPVKQPAKSAVPPPVPPALPTVLPVAKLARKSVKDFFLALLKDASCVKIKTWVGYALVAFLAFALGRLFPPKSGNAESMPTPSASSSSGLFGRIFGGGASWNKPFEVEQNGTNFQLTFEGTGWEKNIYDSSGNTEIYTVFVNSKNIGPRQGLFSANGRDAELKTKTGNLFSGKQNAGFHNENDSKVGGSDRILIQFIVPKNETPSSVVLNKCNKEVAIPSKEASRDY